MRRLATQKDQVAQGYGADFNTVFCYEAQTFLMARSAFSSINTEHENLGMKITARRQHQASKRKVEKKIYRAACRRDMNH